MKKILITEVDEVLGAIYEEKFRSEGFDVVVVEDGNAALFQLKNHPPDVILLDLMLPGVNGVEVLQFMRAEPSLQRLPAIVLSNVYLRSLVQAARDAGADKCLDKANCTPSTLVDEVQSLLAATGSAPCPVPPAAPTAMPSGVDKAENTRVSLRQGFELETPALVAELRQLSQSLIKSDPSACGPGLFELYRAVHSLAGRASIGGFKRISQMSGALEALLNELQAKPKTVNASTLRTVVQAIDFLVRLLEQATQLNEEIEEIVMSPLILVLDDEPISRETICTALEKAQLRGISVEDSQLALKLLEENRFDLIFLDVDMPELNGFEVCKQLRATPLNAATPVVFVTGLTDFKTRALSALSGGNDLIAKPIVLIELAVKAMIHVLRGQAGAIAEKAKRA